MKIPCSISHRARQLCAESEEHHDRVWFCMTCKMLEQRLMPIGEVLADLLADVEVTVESWPAKNVPESGAVNGLVNDDEGACSGHDRGCLEGNCVLPTETGYHRLLE
ncbi:hypothetical protein [Mycobacteroides abscessus]|uniref:hypothetical protein n=1 Tax=Mycobacteroides abscessus TaxID=36809 RepID=UPI001F3A0C65|nr:hypothetical protein [Mycobacteroides abscessus]